ncbi:peptidoglycan DD-metalloendopeptidase family protein [Aquisalimonas lutea]|uniref:murein hydrolase activator EnvC family protein n=1 Tax=Aquisalimonas lutea TaxID=1327750 RepID=UPI0025B3DE82|nr:peptidoglycan DD-metalloendopeptidase family protein [Aquisalimonas lutea]MDN3516637.1 peptidoglycan DD-metalloendopeptidase family protein [Aquisalimonas lutea]
MPIPLPARILLVVCLLVPLAAPAERDYEQSAAELEALRERIAAIESDLEQRQDRRDQVVAELRELEQAIGATTRRLSALDEQLAEAEARAGELREAVAAEKEAAAEHREVLREAVREAYMSAREPFLKLLLNQEDPAALDRLLLYYEYIGEARSHRVEQALQALQRYRDARDALDREMQRLESLRAEQQREQERLSERRQQRQAVLERVEAAIGEGEQRLDRLERDEQELENVVEELRQALADVPERDLDQPSIDEQRGALPWPVRGELDARFGDTRDGGADWRGVLLRTEMGTPVEAVSHGRVVFADWLRGLGLLLIIDHGDGYMTLYGYNQSLYRDVGDWVEAGDVIARVGDSGGRERAGLYFELRVDGQPRDPLRWLE